MIQRMSHTTVYVVDQDRAKAFYTEKLGFEVRDDVKMGNFRWLTVGPKGQPDLNLVLMLIAPGMSMDEATAQKVRDLVDAGKMGAGVFETADVWKTYEELKAKGVTFSYPPKEQPYGIETILRDDSGNWFSLSQRR